MEYLLATKTNKIRETEEQEQKGVKAPKIEAKKVILTVKFFFDWDSFLSLFQ